MPTFDQTHLALPDPAATVSRSGSRQWLVVAGLLLLSFVPVAAGALRVGELASDPVVTDANARFVSSPAPVVVHIVGATVYSLLGAFQLVPALRERHPRYHRGAGRVLVPAGLAAALTGLWMTVAYDLPAHDTVVLGGVRLVVGTSMVAALLLGLRAILRRDVTRHRAWMMRAYALGMGAGTQALLLGPLSLAVGDDAVVRTIGMTLGWALNLAVAEAVIRRQRAASPSRRPRNSHASAAM